MEILIQTITSNKLFDDCSLWKSLKLGSLIGEGAYGQVYTCTAINGQAQSGLVLKILHDDQDGQKGFDTAKKMQDLFWKIEQVRIKQKAISLKKLSCFLAMPRFCFTGMLNGKAVKGFGMLSLNQLGFIPFQNITDTQGDAVNIAIRKKYSELSMVARLKLVHSLVVGLRILAEAYYVHADLNPKNLFLNPSTLEVAIIDFDGGAFMDEVDEKPIVIGKIDEGEWLAPEILERLAQKQGRKKVAKIGLLTDYWSVAVAIHYFLFLRGPYFFLKVISREVVEGYLSQYRWFDAGQAYGAFVGKAWKSYNNYREVISQLPPPLSEKLKQTFNEGFSNPSQRTTSTQWETTISMVIDKKPRIRSFKTSLAEIVEGEVVILTWEIDDAHEVYLNGEEVTGKAEQACSPLFPTNYMLEAKSFGGTSVIWKTHVHVQRFPVILRFEADNYDIGEGKEVVLRWDAQHHSELLLNGKPIPSHLSAYPVIPIGPETTYTLIASNQLKQVVSDKIIIRVHKPPVLKNLWTDRKFLTSDDELVVSWEHVSADEIEIIARQLVGISYYETSWLADARLGKRSIQLTGTCEIIGIAKNAYGSSRISGLQVDVVVMPPLLFHLDHLAKLPEIMLKANIDQAIESPTWGIKARMSASIHQKMPAMYQSTLKSRSRKWAYYSVFCLSLAIVSAVLGYFFALHQ